MLERHHLIADRYHNKGTAFTKDERNRFHLHGILPPVVEDRDTHLACVRTEYDAEHGLHHAEPTACPSPLFSEPSRARQEAVLRPKNGDRYPNVNTPIRRSKFEALH